MDFLNPAARQSCHRSTDLTESTRQPPAYLRAHRQPPQDRMTRVSKQVLHSLLWIILACSLVAVPAQGQFAQQASKLVGSGVVPIAGDMGYSVALSGDGSTAIVGY